MTAAGALTIRAATTGDRDAWLPLWSAYLAFYKVDLPADVTERTWERVVDPASRLSMRLAVLQDRPVGFAIHHFHESTWTKTPDCYLEDLFIDEEIRGKGIGRALIDDLIGICRDNGWSRLYWHTDEGNQRACALYDSYSKSDGHVRYRLKI